jgi:prevent-host-death family protein
MLTQASAMKLRQNLGEFINQVQYRNATIEITKSSKPVAALISIEMFEKIQLMQKEFDNITKKIRTSFKDSSASEVDNLVNEAVKSVRKTK